MINYTDIIISICSVLITGILIPFINSKISKSKRDDIIYWTEIAVRWAKQYLNEDGKDKKEAVLSYLAEKLSKYKLSLDDIDMIIEAVYEQVKGEQ